jgi:AcrR family transcriptional regulator
LTSGAGEGVGDGRRHDGARFATDARARLVTAVKAEVAEHGYARTSVTSLARRADVTRAAFYQHFDDKEACLLAAFDEVAEEVRSRTAAALEGWPPGDAHRRALGVFAQLAREAPSDFMLVTHEAMVAGPRALERRDGLIEDLCARVESSWSGARPAERLPDLPALLMIGGVIRYLGMALRHGSVDWTRDVTELDAWIEAYLVPSRDRRWRVLEPDRGLAQPAGAGGNRIRAPRHLPPRGEVPSVAYSAIEREHIVHAAAALVAERGFDEASVADIAAAAGVPREAFYRQFDDKRAAVDAAATALFEQSIAAMGGAYFGAGTPWADRIWQSSSALTTVLSSAPAFTHVAFIDAFAPDPASARRADELFLGFTIFLTEGAAAADGRSVSSLAPRAITGAMIELGATCAARGAVDDLPGFVPLGVLLTIAPYVGIEDANAFVEERRAKGAAPGREG